MGAVTGALADAARAAGARLLTSADVDRVDADGRTAQVHWTDTRTGVEHRLDARWILGGLAPAALDRPLDRQSSALSPEGAQLKLNMLLTRLPALRSGVDPRVAFAGTFHVDERASDLDRAFRQARSGSLPDTIPGELYCHTLTDPSILAPELAARGWHTLTYFGLHTPARLFAGADHEAVRDAAAERAIAGLDAYLTEPLADCLAVDADARPCLEARSPRDVEADLAMPGGHIFHGDLAWPWLENAPEGPAEAWGVATGIGNVLLCGSGARRGGAVSGIGGHNAAQALLELVGRA